MHIALQLASHHSSFMCVVNNLIMCITLCACDIYNKETLENFVLLMKIILLESTRNFTNTKQERNYMAMVTRNAIWWN